MEFSNLKLSTLWLELPTFPTSKKNREQVPVHSSVAFHRVPVWQKSLLVFHLSSISFPLRHYPLASKWAHVTSTAVWKNEIACVQKQQYKNPIIVLNIFLQDSEFGKIGKNPCEEWISSFDQKRKYQKPKPKTYFHKNHRTNQLNMYNATTR